MSQENVEVVRRVYDAVARRDTAGVLNFYDPEVELVSFSGTLADHMGQRGVYRGHAGLRTFNRDLRDTFETIETNYEELIDAGNHVVSVSRYRARGRATRREALEAAGLSEWAMLRRASLRRLEKWSCSDSNRRPWVRCGALEPTRTASFRSMRRDAGGPGMGLRCGCAPITEITLDLGTKTSLVPILRRAGTGPTRTRGRPLVHSIE